MRNFYIDCLRGLSICFVLLTHGIISCSIVFLPKDAFCNFIKNGYYGVDLFFVISGFLITSHCIKKWKQLGCVIPSDFYVKRIARIFPLLILFLSLCFILFCSKHPQFKISNNYLFFKAILAALNFQYNYFYLSGGNIPGLYHMAILWSLSIEEVFYIVFPLICIVLKKNFLIILGLLVLILNAPVNRCDYASLYTFSGCQDVLAMGVLAAILIDWIKLSFDKFIFHKTALLMIVIGSIIIFTAMFIMPINKYFQYGPSVMGIGGFIFLFGAIFLPPVHHRSIIHYIISPLALIGSLSYEIYLFHCTYRSLVLPIKFLSPFVSSIASIVFLTCGAYIINKFFTEFWNKKIRSYYGL
jgi:peptidoglycan/LPS O-acetylase OafA/YrhL